MRCSGALVLVLLGCERPLPPEECHELRRAAFERLNQPHTCMDDADCWPSEWPGCPKPLGDAAAKQITELRTRFQAGKCDEPDAGCAATPEAFCDRNLCVFRVRR